MVLSTHFSQFAAYFKSQYRYHILIVWAIGQLSGFLSGFSVSEHTVSFMRLADFVRSPLFFRVLFALLPFYLSFFAIRFSKYEFLLITVFLKAFAFSYCTCCIAVAFNLAGWLFRWLVFFGDSISSAIYLSYILISFEMRDRQQKRVFSACVILVLLLVFIDHFVISSFISALLQ